MIFSSVVFLYFFLPAILPFYFLIPYRFRNVLLLASSVIFYAWGETEYLFVAVISIALNYLIGLGFHYCDRLNGSNEKLSLFCSGASAASSHPVRKSLMILGILANLGLLAYYKYIYFVMVNINLLSQWFYPDYHSPVTIGIRAPLGISFISFHAISYVLDVYRSRAPAQKNPLGLALYLLLFPKVLAGPILQYHAAAMQLIRRIVTPEAFASGIERFVIGMAKKVLVAGPLASVSDRIFAIPSNDVTCSVAWLGTISFTLQIYFDFAGYSDMAIGLGRTFGFDLPENFNYPYISQSIQEFWRRWHISLSSWFRDYLYIPMGGNRCRPSRAYFNLITVFFLCGLWHGSNWTFILWGLWHGLFLVIERTGFGALMRSFWRPFRHIYTLSVVVPGWVIFRSESLDYGFNLLKAMVGFGGPTSGEYHPDMFLNTEIALCILVGILASTPLSPALKNMGHRLREPPGFFSRITRTGLEVSYTAYLSALFIISCLSLAGGTHNAFIYFRF